MLSPLKSNLPHVFGMTCHSPHLVEEWLQEKPYCGGFPHTENPCNAQDFAQKWYWKKRLRNSNVTFIEEKKLLKKKTASIKIKSMGAHPVWTDRLCSESHFFFFLCGLLVTLKTYDTRGNAEKMSKEVFEMRTRQDLQLSVNWKCSEVERIA